MKIIKKKEIKRMKNKKTADRLGWKAEWIKEGGEETVKRWYILFNRIKTENHIPIQWQSMNTVLVNTVSKIYESALKIQKEKKNENMSQMQH